VAGQERAGADTEQVTAQSGVLVGDGRKPKTFTDPRLCAAIVDRLTFNGAIIETGTDSYRLAHTQARPQASPDPGREAEMNRWVPVTRPLCDLGVFV
jgi:hypothetical protein